MSQNRARNKKNKEKLICYCNGIPLADVEKAIANGARTMGEIFDRTRAGCGPCGGSCQPEIRRLLEQAKEKDK